MFIDLRVKELTPVQAITEDALIAIWHCAA